MQTSQISSTRVRYPNCGGAQNALAPQRDFQGVARGSVRATRSSPIANLPPHPAAPIPAARTLQTYGYLSGGIGIAVATGLGVARAGLFTLAAAHPLAFFLTSAASNQAALATTKAAAGSHEVLRHAAFAVLSIVLGASSAAIGPVGMGVVLSAGILCAGAFVGLSIAAHRVPAGLLERTDGLVGRRTQVWFALTLASLAVPPLGTLSAVQASLALSGASLFAVGLTRNAQRTRLDASKNPRFDAMQAAIDLSFPTFCLFTLAPSVLSAL